MSSSSPPPARVTKASEQGGFYGVYLLVSENAAYRGRTYIGFTVDPARRLRQHNRGSHAGGAWKTSCKGPWSMVLITHGFPNEVSALRVEWAWQHPASSRRLRAAPRKRAAESRLQYSVRLLGTILRTAPWCALPLTVTWLDHRYHTPFPDDIRPPPHIPVAFCSVAEVKKSTRRNTEDEIDEDYVKQVCSLCARPFEDSDKLKCPHTGCLLTSHVVCLGQHLASHPSHPHPTLNQPSWVNNTAPATDPKSIKKQARLAPAPPLVPVEGPCPACGGQLLWGDLVRPISVACASSRGSNRGKGVWAGPEPLHEVGDERQEELELTDDESEDEDHWANMLTQQ